LLKLTKFSGSEQRCLFKIPQKLENATNDRSEAKFFIKTERGNACKGNIKVSITMCVHTFANAGGVKLAFSNSFKTRR
jgi:hypothetical protein